ncbi:MAG: branched-chain amino acid ABC transporter permease/ATP-binding protein [Actinomycetota bacterium]|nr:branched-chain amino acid ABC transporter permease/ATP-binding protein [Actinomycetota bacterium]
MLLGLGNGAVFAALALALVVTYRSSGVLNFATGALSLQAAYTYAFLRRGELLTPIPGLPRTIDIGGDPGFWPAMLITVALEAVVGVVLYLTVFRPLRTARPLAKAVGSLGVMVLLTAIVSERAGPDQVLVKRIFPAGNVTFGDIRIVSDRMWFAITIIGITVVLAAVSRFTRFGLATRAAAESEVGALVSGLAPERIAVANWAISAAVAAVAGVLIAPLVPLIPGTYTLFIVPALAAAVLGQFSAVTPAVIGGIAIGMLQSEAVFLRGRHSWFPQNGAAELIPLVLVLAVLVVRGRPLPARGALVLQSLGRAPRPRHLAVPAVVGLVVGVIGIFATDGSYRSALINTLILGVISLSLVVVTGYCGQISLAQLTLAGVAGFSLSTFTDSWGIPFPIAPLLAALAATVVGVLVGLPALRIRGLLVGVVTLTLAVAVEAVWFRNNDFNGGSDGAPVKNPELFGVDLGIGQGASFPRPEFGLLCLVVLAAVAFGVAKLRTSGLGSAMLAVRANERSASAAGISVVRVKVVGFAIGSFIAGLGGCLLAYKQTNVTYQSFNAIAGLTVFSTAFLAGITSVSGGIVAGVISAGGIFFLAIDRSVDVGQWYAILSGLGVVLAVTTNPEGAVGPAHVLLERRRSKANPTATAATPVATPEGGASAPPRREGGDTLLSVDHVTVTFGGVLAVDDVSFAVREGTITGLIGPNGAGKTTTMDALCGFADCAGEVRLAGRALEGLPPHQRARAGLGRTFQGLDLYEDLTVEENVVVGQHMAGADEDALREVLDTLHLAELRDRHVHELSQGQRQLVSIARALAGRPKLLLLDEPAAGLDTTESEWLADRLRAVRDAGVTILLVDHDMNLVLGVCDTIHVLDLGKVLASGPPSVIRDDRSVAEAYLGTSHAPAEPGPAGGARG